LTKCLDQMSWPNVSTNCLDVEFLSRIKAKITNTSKRIPRRMCPLIWHIFSWNRNLLFRKLQPREILKVKF
jgi:hypothetical protein